MIVKKCLWTSVLKKVENFLGLACKLVFWRKSKIFWKFTRDSNTREFESREICEKTGKFTRDSNTRKSESREICERTGEIHSGFQHPGVLKSRNLWKNGGNSLGIPTLGSPKVEKFVKKRGNSLGISKIFRELLVN